MVLTNFEGNGVGFGFGVGCGFGVGWGFGVKGTRDATQNPLTTSVLGMPLNIFGLGAGGGCGVGLGLGWGFGSAFGSQYRISKATFQGIHINKNDNISTDSSKNKQTIQPQQ